MRGACWLLTARQSGRVRGNEKGAVELAVVVVVEVAMARKGKKRNGRP